MKNPTIPNKLRCIQPQAGFLAILLCFFSFQTFAQIKDNEDLQKWPMTTSRKEWSLK